ncbi:hypothetical protein LSH36_864g00054 [Paralvinella palmiformis]|uniref:N(6)-L-threonylcarbamoyladenine synthase n=1 Tax=Paralvinella palmiformis TaxID=53620 RepID=A0AAD9MTF9_9ANNE|nr:hypothetical protein LSH36_864g00054 [Paralvinella palmiformis]
MWHINRIHICVISKIVSKSFFLSKSLTKYSTHSKRIVLGIESSCDDTAAAVVDEAGTVLGEAINSQTELHVEVGGIVPHVARDLHQLHIDDVVQSTLHNAGISLEDVDAVATTVKPGLHMSLDVGMKYTKQLLKNTWKPFIPIHHMEAHALTARMIDSSIEFPFLVLLASGGHCLLAVAEAVDHFLLLGKSLDVAPGDSFDKIARALKLVLLPEYQGLCGGAAVELMAKGGDPHAFVRTPIMQAHVNCDFSFSGVQTRFEQQIEKQEAELGLDLNRVLPSVSDICASFQYNILQHLSNRVQRAIIFCHREKLLPLNDATVVLSGGVASNQFLRQGLQRVCEAHGTRLVCPPPKLCTDNGIMIAWNGIEKLKTGLGIEDINSVEVLPRCPLGRDISADVDAASIKVWKIPLL